MAKKDRAKEIFGLNEYLIPAGKEFTIKEFVTNHKVDWSEDAQLAILTEEGKVIFPNGILRTAVDWENNEVEVNSDLKDALLALTGKTCEEAAKAFNEAYVGRKIVSTCVRYRIINKNGDVQLSGKNGYNWVESPTEAKPKTTRKK